MTPAAYASFREMSGEGGENEGQAPAAAAAAGGAADLPPSDAARLAREHGMDARHWTEFAPPGAAHGQAVPQRAPASAYTAAQRAHRLAGMQQDLERKMAALKALHADANLAPEAAAEAADKLADDMERDLSVPAERRRAAARQR